jgi:polyisoprenoid-binding protein YceI
MEMHGRRLAPLVSALLLCGMLVTACGGGPKTSAKASEIAAAALPKPAGAVLSGTYTITSSSTASYTAHETFLTDNLPNVPVGVTHGVSGTLVLANGLFTPSTVTVNLTGLKTDSSLRDRHVQQTLDTSQYPDATFQVTGESATAELVRAQGVATLDLQGEMTIHGQTHPAVWKLQVGMAGGVLQVRGTTNIEMTAFGVRPPSIAGFVNVKPAILLSVDLTASTS